MNLAKLKGVPAKLLSIAYAWNDYRRYAQGIKGYCHLAETMQINSAKGSLLIVSGRGMNVVWAQIWTLLSLAARAKGYRAYVLTTRRQWHLNWYFRLLRIAPLYFEDYVAKQSTDLPDEIAPEVNEAKTFEDFKRLRYQGAPVGEIALSTYSRHCATGIIDLSKPEVWRLVSQWVVQVIQSMHIANTIFGSHDVRLAFFTEVFMEEYGAFYYAALAKELNVVRFAGTVRDDAIIVQHLNKHIDRAHHAALSPSSWERVKAQPYTPDIDGALQKNFMDRYGDRWYRSKRNQPGTQILNPNEARRQLGIVPGRKAAVIYSHILYDTLFFFGSDLFSDYAEWLVETVRVACANTHIDWLIKVHPSNLWRGELNTQLKGCYEEERLIKQVIGKLPQHVRVVPASTKLNPYTWFQLADYGITVRGTSGLEMAALGKSVITAGTGRYEGNGFTIDPPTREAYLDLLSSLPELPEPTEAERELAKRYAYSIFVLKPFTLTCLEPRLKTGKDCVVASDDIIYCPVDHGSDRLPPDLQVFSDWLDKTGNQDLLNNWGAN
jgi:hypothetical protein